MRDCEGDVWQSAGRTRSGVYTETWAEEAGPWVNDLARNSYLLQQGLFAADLVYFYGEDSNLTAIFADKASEMPAGYGFFWPSHTDTESVGWYSS